MALVLIILVILGTLCFNGYTIAKISLNQENAASVLNKAYMMKFEGTRALMSLEKTGNAEATSEKMRVAAMTESESRWWANPLRTVFAGANIYSPFCPLYCC